MTICRKIKRKLSCYLDKELAEREEILINRHLMECSECRDELNLLLKVSKTLKADEETVSFPNFEVRFWKRVAENEERRFGWLNPLPLLPQAAIIPRTDIESGIRQKIQAFLRRQKGSTILISMLSLFGLYKYPSFSFRFSLSMSVLGIIILIGMFLGIGAGQIRSMSLARQEFISSLNLARFSNFQPNSISIIYQKMSNHSGG